MCSSLPVGNHCTQQRLGEEFYKRWEIDTFQGPFLETVPTYATRASLADIFSPQQPLRRNEERFRELCQPKYEVDQLVERLSNAGVDSRRLQPHLYSQDGLRSLWDRRLYEHQLRAFSRLVNKRENLIVATGTGSGKTECFLLPLLFWLLGETDEVRKCSGVRALLLYPMNALVEDQMRRLRAILSWINGQAKLAPSSEAHLARPITFGRYVGTTRVNRADNSPERRDPDDQISELGEMLYREDMQHSPPDILITNFTMLEYILLRNDDKKLFSRPEFFRLLVLDEIHAYRGTQGMEVACLLRRFDDLLCRKTSGQKVQYVHVGLSATLPGSSKSREETASFASGLFGASFNPDSIVAEQELTPAEPNSAARGPWPRVRVEISRLWELAPNLCQAFAVNCSKERDEQAEEIPPEEWQLLATALESSYIQSSADSNLEPIELLGRVLEVSPVVQALGDIVRGGRVVSLDSVGFALFGDSGATADRDEALGVLLQLVCAGRVEDKALLPLRVHFFVKEQKDAYVCISPRHTQPEPGETDGWWKTVYLVHHSICDKCGARVFPLALCRRCGFVLLEGWLRKGKYFSERDGLMPKSEFTKVLFRPLSGIPDYLGSKFKDHPPDGVQVQEFRLCARCGLRIFMGSHGDSAAEAHLCGKDHLVPTLEWSSPASGVRVTRCPHCDQEWYQDQEVFTPPALSAYGAATILLEETKRAVDAPLKASINKVLCFSDSRQQAARIARRLGRTNEDFVFRQLIFQALRDSPGRGLFTKELVDSILKIVASDFGLAELFCERSESPRDRDLLKRRISTLLLRELCTEYLTLERMGIIQIAYPESLNRRGVETLGSDPLGKRLSSLERQAFLHLSLDWVFRLNRWAVTPSTLDFEYEKLSFYGYRDKTVALKGEAGGSIGFSMGRLNSASRRLDFYFRVSQRFDALKGLCDLRGFNGMVEEVWKKVICEPTSVTRIGGRGGPDPGRPFVALQGGEPSDYRLKLNFEAISWRLIEVGEDLFRCDRCQYVTSLNVQNVCSVRACAGELVPVTLANLRAAQFSPTCHYIELATERQPKPLWVEEHTAQISPSRRAEVEKEFRDDSVGSLDVISGSTTFELGVDLGTINAIFLANLPPQVSNYRQRAGRAGRRPGMMPFIISYVRQRPHDKYFWSNLQSFIGGPLRVPWLASPSREIILRHSNAVIFARMLELYGQASALQGPPCGQFASFCLNPAQRSRVRAEGAQSTSELTRSLRSVLSINPTLSLTAQDCVDHYFKVVDFSNMKYFASHFDEGAINVFSDYGILPSYSFPLYVDELVLYQKPRTEPPRRDLKLQRDRKIALSEYFPGRLIAADKWVLESVGLRNGYEQRVFAFCPKCHHISATSISGPCETAECGGQNRTCRVVVPKGGFLGQVPRRPPTLDPTLFELQTSEVIFDPAADPPPPMEKRGRFVFAARQSAGQMTDARMRMFSPRPAFESGLELVESLEMDVADPARAQSLCLVLPNRAAPVARGQVRDYYLMHEFTTDILRLQFTSAAEGTVLSAGPLQDVLKSDDQEERAKARTIFLYTLGQALTTGAARHLQIDPAELEFTLRFIPGDAALKTELIVFDTAPGGAGNASKCFEEEELRGVFRRALDVLSCQCGDSCYECLRSYGNQWMHARLNRQYVLPGLKSFIGANWLVSKEAAAAV
ncbi:MAG: DEAD/DEAH box helicase [Terriglobia bacterium]